MESAKLKLLAPVETSSAPSSPLPAATRFEGFNLRSVEAGASDEAGAAHGCAVGRSLGATAVLTMTTLTMAGCLGLYLLWLYLLWLYLLWLYLLWLCLLRLYLLWLYLPWLY